MLAGGDLSRYALGYAVILAKGQSPPASIMARRSGTSGPT